MPIKYTARLRPMRLARIMAQQTEAWRNDINFYEHDAATSSGERSPPRVRRRRTQLHVVGVCAAAGAEMPCSDVGACVGGRRTSDRGTAHACSECGGGTQ
jgi:hypothetical protein